MSGDGSEYVGQQILGKGIVIAIDGPSGSGKSTVARVTAAELGLQFLDTGAMYRALTWWLLYKGVDPNDSAQVSALAPQVPMTVEDFAHAPRILISGVRVDKNIRSQQVNDAVSKVSRYPAVRAEMIKRQQDLIVQAIASGRGIVAEGRDITTVVAPDADVKILLTASPEVRQQRREAESGSAKGMLQRDASDSLVNDFTNPGEGVHLIDTTDMTIDDVMKEIVHLVGEVAGTN